MISVNFMNNSDSQDYMGMPTETIEHAIKACGLLNPAYGMIHIDGRMLSNSDLNKTFADFGYNGMPGHDEATISQIAKAKNA